MPATRTLPTPEAVDLIGLTRELAEKELAPRVAEAEAEEKFPREVFRTLGRAGLLSLPYAEEYGGGDQSYEVYLQVLEEIAAVWASVGVGVSVGKRNADHMIDESTPRINEAERAQRHARMDQARANGVLDWAAWWELAAQDPVLAAPTARRFEIYGEHADGDMPSADWHTRVLREKGFGEARAVWRSPSDALVLAVK